MRILVADDYPFVRKNVRTIVERQTDWVVCAEAVDGLDAVRKVSSANPDLVVMDLSMPNMNGFEAAREILKVRAELPIIILSMHDSADLREEAKSIGIKGFVVKGNAGQELFRAIAAVTNGQTYFP
jgi:DNA-binding NarL/FixJ family response regulator